MFENMIGQPVVDRLRADIKEGRLSASMLFAGPEAAGKGTAALELGRALSCANAAWNGGKGEAKWKCECPACALHRLLVHPDLMILGPRQFQMELNAASGVFNRDLSDEGARTFFIRAARKLLTRFTPAIWEGESKITKLNSLIESLNDDLDALTALQGAASQDKAAKRVASIVKTGAKLESEAGISRDIPVFQIRNAAYWLRLSPSGPRKLLVIENADTMNESARNALLKTLEEPPETAAIVLCSAHHKALLPTILSRVRPYTFIQRDRETEADVLRRVFRQIPPAAPSADAAPPPGIAAYLSSFLPVSRSQCEALSAYFAASVAKGAYHLSRGAFRDTLTALGKHAAPLAESAGLGRPAADTRTAIATVLAGAGNFASRALFDPFLAGTLTCLRDSAAQTAYSPAWITLSDTWRKRVKEAQTAVDTYNQNPGQALTRLCDILKTDIAAL